MAYHARSIHFFLAALLATQVLSTYIPAVELAPDTSPSPVTSLDVYEAAWDGSTDVGANLEARLTIGQITLYGIAAGLLGVFTSSACTSPFVLAGSGIPCAIGLAATGIAAVVASIAAYKQKDTRDIDALDEFFEWKYPAIEEGPTSQEQIHHAMNVEFNDGLPVLIGWTNCTSEYNTCHKLWYSESTHFRAGENRTIHRVHVTPHEYDFRQPQQTPIISRRQTFDDDDATETSSNGQTLYGGYVWEVGSQSTLSQINSDNTNDITQSIVDTMNNENIANGKYARTGLYCQDWATPSDSSPGTLGYLWYFTDPSDYPSGDESAWLQTCAEESDDPAPTAS